MNIFTFIGKRVEICLIKEEEPASPEDSTPTQIIEGVIGVLVLEV